MTEDESFQKIADDIAVARDADLEPVTEPFEPMIEALGLAPQDQAAEKILVYRESPDRECYSCGEAIPSNSRNLDAGEEYLIQRVNEPDSPYPLLERTYHVECWDRRRDRA